jgi:DNA-binding MarR family transcriptional regulator
MTVVAPAAASVFGTQVIRRTERALDAVLARQLAATGLTQPRWAVLTLTVVGGGLQRDALVVRVAGALRVDWWAAREHISELAAAGLVRTTPDEAVEPTECGEALWRAVRAAVGEVTERLWGDLPEADLATAGRVLETVLTRANALLVDA